MALGSTQSLPEISTRNLPVGKRRLAHKADNFTAICESTARRLVVAVCAPHKLSRCKGLTVTDECVGDPHLYTLSLVAPDPMGIGTAMVLVDWLVLASIWEDPARLKN
jgi:hypothetical protein